MCRVWIWCILGLLVFSVEAAGQAQHGFRISFTDKKGTTQTLGNPLGYLSQRAIDRRTALNIAIDSTDLPVSADYMDSVLTLTGGKLHMTSKWFNYTVLLLNDSAKILALQGKPYIKDIQYIAYYAGGLHKPGKTNTPTQQPQQGSQIPLLKTTGSAAYYGDAYAQTALVNGDFLHDLGRKGEGMLIAVLDEGFANVDTGPAFDSLRSSNRIIDRYNFVKADNNVYTNGNHGTTSLSLISANLPGTYVGTAPHADIALYITEVQGSEQELEMDNLVAASERADSVGADVITVSLGYDRFNLPVFHSLTYAEIDGKTTIAARGANMATTKGILFVASAGNEGGGSWNYILTPGDADSAITVGNVNNSKVPAGNSGYGPNSSGRIKPDVCMQGQPAYVMTGGPNPQLSSGTSVSTPQLAGWAACLMQASGNHTPYQIRTAIQKSANMYQTPGVQLGYGVPNFHYALQLLQVRNLPEMPDAGNWITAGPNPFEQDITLRVYADKETDLHLSVTDITGKVVFMHSAKLSKGTLAFIPGISHLARGTYILSAITGDKQKTLKLVKR